VHEALALYDQERRAAADPGLRREALSGLIRLTEDRTRFSTIIYTNLDAGSVDQAIEEQIAFCERLGYEFEWKVFAHDQPIDLVDRLRDRGFAIDEPEAIVVLDIPTAQPRLFEPTPAVRRVVDPLEAPERIRWEMRDSPETLSVYVAEVDGQLVAHGWARFPRSSAFASLWGGETDPAFRNQGLYAQLVARRVQEARARGYRYATVDARSTSRPILERRGFQVMTFATACTWPRSS
jgi:GNAT superfamily N-acetyltransferase